MQDDEILEDAEAAEERDAIREALPALVAEIQSRYQSAKSAKYPVERRWMQAYDDYRGVYHATGAEYGGEVAQSQVFLKIAKTKTLAAFGQLVEVVFPANKGVPIEIFPTPKPMGIARYAHIQIPSPEGEEEDLFGNDFNVGFTGDDILGGAKAQFSEGDWEAGPAETGKAEIEPARIAANNMNLTIQDQLVEAGAERILRGTLFEAALYGTGLLKGPTTLSKEVAAWSLTAEDDEQGQLLSTESEYTPKFVDIPDLSMVSVWNAFPDPEGTNMGDIDWFIERHKMTRSQMRALRNRPHFNSEAIAKALLWGPNYIEDQTVDQLGDPRNAYESDRFEVLEFWGVLDVFMAEEIGLEIPESVSLLEEASFNVWLCGDEVLRIVINPFKPTRLPYHAMPYEFDPNSFWGVGVPENMADATEVMNGHMRLAIDNLALSGNVILDVNEAIMEPGQSFSLSPGKVFRSNGQPGQKAVNAITIPNQTQQHIFMMDKARQMADEETGIPSFSHGATGTQSQTRTASGMSMLMGAASMATKTVVKNVDDFLLKPLGQALFHWNMQFNPDPSIAGDLSVRALGTESVMQKEVQSQRLTQFLQVASNPGLAPYVNLPYIVEELSKAMDIDPERAINSPEQAMVQAEIMGASGQQVGGAPQQPQEGGQPPKGGVPEAGGGQPPQQGSTGNGGGTIGTGKVPVPGEKEFSGNVG